MITGVKGKCGLNCAKKASNSHPSLSQGDGQDGQDNQDDYDEKDEDGGGDVSGVQPPWHRWET